MQLLFCNKGNRIINILASLICLWFFMLVPDFSAFSQTESDQLDKSYADLLQRIRAALSEGDTLKAGNLYIGMGDAFKKAQKPTESLNAFYSAYYHLQKADTLGYQTAAALRKLGQYYNGFDPDSSIFYYQKAQTWHEKLEDWKHFGMVLSEIGFQIHAQGKTEEGLKMMLEAVELLERFAEEELERAYNNLYLASVLAGQKDKARYYEQLAEDQQKDQIVEVPKSQSKPADPEVTSTNQQTQADLAESIRQEQESRDQIASKQLQLEKARAQVAEAKKIRPNDPLIRDKELLIDKAAAELRTRILEKEQEISRLNRKMEIERQDQQAAQALFTYIGIGLMIGIVGLGLAFYVKARTNKQLLALNSEISEQKEEIEVQKERIEEESKKSEALLLNILPKATSEELKARGRATPRHYDLASVLFTDFAGFSAIAEDLPAETLVSDLNACFLAFDQISEDCGLEKIKTIGDAFMCAGGIPEENDTHPADAVRAGLQMQAFMTEWNADRKQRGLMPFPLRVGIHSGPLVAGVVGRKRFAYDIWGATVNLASRMESNCAPGKVNISEATFQLVKTQFQCTYRGQLAIKNLGQAAMYYVSPIY